MKIIAERILEADEKRGLVNYKRIYLSHTGYECKQTKTTQRESDYANEKEYRTSLDNGKTYTEWAPVERTEYSKRFGEDEMISQETSRIWNPIHRHYVSTWWSRYFIDGHEKAYRHLWREGKLDFFDHQYIAISDSGDGGIISKKLVKYEDGVDFDPQKPNNPEFLMKNRGFLNAPIVLKNGDIAVAVGVPVPAACNMAGLDVQSVFPSCPNLHRGVMVARGKYNTGTNEYDLSFSNPIILDDLRSSRGIDEPILAELEGGRILLVMRGSNVRSEAWNTRIKEGTPTYKWYSFSDDGGKTFTEAMPWRFDSGKPIYSAATISKLIRSSKNKRLYWIGNISDEHAYGNFPRFPLYICEVDDKSALLKKGTLTVIDTRREGESEKLQLSNFSLIEDRESGNFEITLAKNGQFDPNRSFFGESWKYTVVL
ncbi:MAG: exo-alpha-sialidase [Ruminococcaceae bacterium]|nr:exo-alpha-sialidase [Oscillospiraceae bacterium]